MKQLLIASNATVLLNINTIIDIAAGKHNQSMSDDKERKKNSRKPDR